MHRPEILIYQLFSLQPCSDFFHIKTFTFRISVFKVTPPKASKYPADIEIHKLGISVGEKS